jgi:DnaJ-class molecular chaperone
MTRHVDHYRVLQVTRDAEPEVIERAYRALARKHHPDRAAGDKQRAHSRMQEVNEAYRVLSDPERRRHYDAGLPAAEAHGWDLFLERGLVGLFLDRYRSGRRSG